MAYEDKILALSPVGYWMLDEASGTIAYDSSGNSYNGTISGDVTLAQAGIGDGKTSMLFGGTNGYISLATPFGVVGRFPVAEGTLMAWVKISTAAWENGALNYAVYFYTNTGKQFSLCKWSTSHTFQFVASAQNQVEVSTLFYKIDWFHVAVTWSDSGDYVKYYVDGNLIRTEGDPATGGTYCSYANIGRQQTALYFIGNMAHVALFNTPLSAANILIAARDQKYKTLTAIGDSITFAAGSWEELLSRAYYGGDIILYDRSQGGISIMSGMNVYVAAAASDDADFIIIEMGINDNNSGDMTALQTAAEGFLTTLHTTNPNARIYWFVLPSYASATPGAALVAKGNIRTAVAAACAAKDATYWDSVTVPWILPADTSDGVHPTAAGHAKVAAAVQALLPAHLIDSTPADRTYTIEAEDRTFTITDG